MRVVLEDVRVQWRDIDVLLYHKMLIAASPEDLEKLPSLRDMYVAV